MRASLALELYNLLHLPITRKECAALEYSTVPWWASPNISNQLTTEKIEYVTHGVVSIRRPQETNSTSVVSSSPRISEWCQGTRHGYHVLPVPLHLDGADAV